ncbi:MAG TPA: hypothetical protein VKT75_16835 [Acidobacteriaceae bacterium]|jgi:hypothetical protein|nr:hypothetical protein [Acidobacteriaceae bacterium]
MRQDVYKVAYDEAHGELLEISKRFEELKQRKESLESVVGALAPMLGAVVATPAAQPVSEPKPPASEPAPEAANYTFNQVAAALPEADEAITDPFQRRVRNALKFSSNNNGHEHRGLQPAV